MEACYRSKEVEQNDSLPTFQNGECTFSQSSAPSGRIGRRNRPVRRILSPLSSSQIQEVSQNSRSGYNFPFQSNVLPVMHESDEVN